MVYLSVTGRLLDPGSVPARLAGCWAHEHQHTHTAYSHRDTYRQPVPVIQLGPDKCTSFALDTSEGTQEYQCSHDLQANRDVMILLFGPSLCWVSIASARVRESKTRETSNGKVSCEKCKYAIRNISPKRALLESMITKAGVEENTLT